MDFNESLNKFLLDNTIIKAETGTKVYCETVPDEFLYNYPLIVFSFENNDIEETFDTQDDVLQIAEIRIDVYSNKRADTLRITKKIIKEFRNFYGKLTDEEEDKNFMTGINYIYMQNDFERLGKNRIEYRTVTLFQFYYNEIE